MKTETPITVEWGFQITFRLLLILLFGITFFCLLSWFPIHFALAQDKVVQVLVRSSVEVTEDVFYLKDIASIASPDDLKTKIGAIRIGTSPMPGKERVIQGSHLASMLKGGKIVPEDAQMTVPDEIRIARASQSVSEEELQRLFERSVREMLEGHEYKIGQVKIWGTNRFPAGKLSIQPLKHNKQELAGNVTLQVQIRVNEENCGRLNLSAWVDRFMPVVAVVRDIKHHAILDAEDLDIKTVNVSTMPADLVTDKAKAVGKQMKMALREGTFLRSGMMINPPLVQKGDRVKIVASSGRLKVSIDGIAKGTGGKGDQIEVENVVSNKVIVGRVTDKATVEVMF